LDKKTFEKQELEIKINWVAAKKFTLDLPPATGVAVVLLDPVVHWGAREVL
jgi:hypothetical protein